MCMHVPKDVGSRTLAIFIAILVAPGMVPVESLMDVERDFTHLIGDTLQTSVDTIEGYKNILYKRNGNSYVERAF